MDTDPCHSVSSDVTPAGSRVKCRSLLSQHHEIDTLESAGEVYIPDFLEKVISRCWASEARIREEVELACL